ncbi:zinc finger X-chromosomal protein-like [Cotesia typhae]|uniref:zinc finger X-chromosomal protein-like n=1 Tax=Cotesia typhae TaxID=2053667 RepID=UPI003D68D081
MLATTENNGLFLSDPCTDFQPQSMIPGKQGASGYSVLPLMKNLATMWLAKQRTQFSYRCDRCGKGYQHRATLVRHTRHECGKDPKFKCPYCVHRTKQRGNLYQHIRTNHPGKNVFTRLWANYPPQQFPRVESYSSHLGSMRMMRSSRRSMTRQVCLDKRPGCYYCPKCGKGYRWVRNMKTHLKLECGKEPTEFCPYCPHKTRHKRSLQMHILRIHSSK